MDENTKAGAQTERPGAVGPVRGLLGGTNLPAALFLCGAVSDEAVLQARLEHAPPS
jgi:hypothetical protein